MCKSVKVIYHIHRTKDKSHMITSIEQKSINKIQHLFIIKKNLNTWIILGSSSTWQRLSMTNSQPTLYLIEKNWKHFRTTIRQRMSTFMTLIQYSTRCLSLSNWRRERNMVSKYRRRNSNYLCLRWPDFV
jgi:hypothetical protein